jgi:tetratricopeptide (TPR) repeat protein
MERRTVFTLAGVGAAVTLCALVFGRAPQAAATSARVPIDPGEVLETLPFAAADPRAREIASLRAALAKSTLDLPGALRLARLDIELARERSDPRYLGHAQAALRPWWHDEQSNVDVLVLQATIEQSLHDFEAALRHLDFAVAAEPTHVQAWLTRAVVLTVRGRYAEAKESCARLSGLTTPLVIAVCATGIESVTGHAKEAYDRLGQVLTGSRRISTDEESWARSSLAEYAARAGLFDEAEKHFRRTIDLDPNDGYVRAACADLFLDLGKPKDALALVQGRDANDTLLLRIAIAERRLKSPDAASHIAALEARFDASRLRGDVVHRREEARFWLELKDDAARALPLATANWEVQKETADARILLEAARAARDRKVVVPLLAWLAETKLEDPFIAKVAADLR